MKKKCSKCGKEKDTKDFSPKKRNKSGIAAHCKECNKKWCHENYLKNKKWYLERNKKYKHSMTEYISEAKEGGCVICGYNKTKWSLSFHHRHKEEKERDINSIRRNGGINQLKKEIKKCIVVCNNCHGEIHAGLINIEDMVTMV